MSSAQVSQQAGGTGRDAAAPREAAAGRCSAGGAGAPAVPPLAARGAHDAAGGATSQSLTSGSSGGTTGGTAAGRAGADDATATLHSGPARAATPATGAPRRHSGEQFGTGNEVWVLCSCASTGEHCQVGSCRAAVLPQECMFCRTAPRLLVQTHETRLCLIRFRDQDLCLSKPEQL